MKVTGLRGQDLQQAWQNGAEAHLGITVAGFPNFFMLYGPNTNLAHNSIVYMIESQIHYVMACLARLCRDEIRSIEIKKDIQDRFNARIQQRMQNTQWSKGCTSWYLTATGKNTTNWPGYSFEFTAENPRTEVGRLCRPIARTSFRPARANGWPRRCCGRRRGWF